MNIECFLIGGTSLLQKCCMELISRGHLVRGIISDDPDIIKFSQQEQIPVYPFSDAVDLINEVRKVDYLFSIACLRLIESNLINAPKIMAINYHNGYLPQYAGLNAPTWALINNEHNHGVTWHVIIDEFDAGDIIEQIEIPIKPDETSFTLNLKCYKAAIDLFKTLIDKIETNTLTLKPQDLTKRTICPKLNKLPNEECIEWNSAALDIERYCRALTFGTQQNKHGIKIKFKDGLTEKVKKIRIMTSKSGRIPGTILKHEGQSVHIATKDFDLSVDEFFTGTGSEILLTMGLLQGDVLPSSYLTPKNNEQDYSSSVAIVGMAGRFPGANNLDEFWHNVQNGIDTITHFSDEELLKAGVPLSTIENPNFVKARGVINNAEYFDADFFGFTQHAAELMDPQERIFLETVWHALESSGYVNEEQSGITAVFAGASQWDSYLWQVLNKSGKSDNPVENFERFSENSLDFLATHVSYAFNLTGPSYTIQSACSTGLSTICLACESLLVDKCDVAVAGAINIMFPRAGGYFYTEGMIFSPDGLCKPFDINSQGTVLSEGVGVVILKRAEDAIRDGDTILAIIKGFGVNNDGSSKIGFTAPSITGQSNVIVEALAIADFDPESIDYMETHGTGTKIGDPIEIRALTDAYRSLGAKKNQYCAIGSLKSNIGHLDVAAGIAGLIKTVLSLNHQQIPPLINYTAPNPSIDFANSPFYINHQLKSWDKKNTPRRAGVSSFGVGGTNTHIALEESPPKINLSNNSRDRSLHILTLSAKSDAALDEMIQDYIQFLSSTHESLSDICFTANTCRRKFQVRTAVYASSIAQLIDRLSANNLDKFSSVLNYKVSFNYTHSSGLIIHENDPDITVDIGPDTVEEELCKTLVDFYHSGAEINWIQFDKPYLRTKVALPLYPFQRQKYVIESQEFDNQYHTVHPLLGEMHSHPNGGFSFFLRFDLAKLSYFKDHIVFDYIILPGAAYIEMMLAAGILSLNTEEIHLSKINYEAALRLETGKQVEMQVTLTPMEVGYEIAIFSQMDNSNWICHATGIVKIQQVVASTIDLNRFKEQCTQSFTKEEFYNQLHQFGMNLGPLFQNVQSFAASEHESFATLSTTLSTANYFAHPTLLDGSLLDGAEPIIGMLDAQKELKYLYIPFGCDSIQFYKRLPQNIIVHWHQTEFSEDSRVGDFKIYSTDGELLISLEGYRFKKTSQAGLKKVIAHEQNTDLFYQWNRIEYSVEHIPHLINENPLLIIHDEQCPGTWINLVKNMGIAVECVPMTNPCKSTFINLIKQREWSGIIQLAVNEAPTNLTPKVIRDAQKNGCENLLYLSQALIEVQRYINLPVFLISRDTLSFSTLNGFHKTILLEHPDLKMKHIIILNECSPELLRRVILNQDEEPIVHINLDTLQVPRLHKIFSTNEKTFNGTIHSDASYLITGGMGGLGEALTKWLIDKGAGQIILTSRSIESDTIVPQHNNTTLIIHEQLDVSNEHQVAQLLARLTTDAKPLKGIFHLAGMIDDAPLMDQDWLHFEKLFATKVYGTFYLHQYSKNLDLFVMFSSISSILGMPGQSNYAAANSFMDAFCQYRRAQNLPSHTLCWGPWADVGMAKELTSRLARGGIKALQPQEGIEAIEHVLNMDIAQIIIAKMEWKTYIHHLSQIPSWLNSLVKPQVNTHVIQDLIYLEPEEAGLLLKKIITDSIRELIGIDSTEVVDPHKSFFDMGFDSLSAIELKNRLATTLGDKVKLHSTSVFGYPSIAQLAEHLLTELNLNVPKTYESKPLHKENLKWLIKGHAHIKPKLRIFCFHFVGGSALFYKGWQQSMPEGVEIIAIQLPGRDNRYNEPLLYDMETVVSSVVDEIQHYLDVPFIMFGHSMGSMIVSEVVLKLEHKGLALPKHLILSSYIPNYFSPNQSIKFKKISNLNDKELIAFFDEKYESLSTEFVNDADLRASFIKRIRADLAILSANFALKTPFDIDITTIHCSEDKDTTEKGIKLWQKATTKLYRHYTLSGGHLALLNDAKPFTDLLISIAGQYLEKNND